MRRVRIDTVLRHINQMRREQFGLRPLKRVPRGVRGSPWSCPLAKAFHQSIGSDEALAFLTPELGNFVYLFDNGRYPELVK